MLPQLRGGKKDIKILQKSRPPLPHLRSNSDHDARSGLRAAGAAAAAPHSSCPGRRRRQKAQGGRDPRQFHGGRAMAVVHLAVQRQDQALEPLPRRESAGLEGRGLGLGVWGGSFGAETLGLGVAAACRSHRLPQPSRLIAPRVNNEHPPGS